MLVEPEEGCSAMFELAQLVYQLTTATIVEFNLYASLLSPSVPLFHTVLPLVHEPPYGWHPWICSANWHADYVLCGIRLLLKRLLD